MKWQNNYFRIIGSLDSLKIIQKSQGAVAIPHDNDNYLLIKIKRTDNKEHWEFPRGFSKKNEIYSQTAVRELTEETGLTKIGKTKNLGIIMPDSGLLTSKIGLVLVDVDFSQKIILQKSEAITDYQVVNLSQIAKMIKKGIIIDSFTLAAYCHLTIK